MHFSFTTFKLKYILEGLHLLICTEYLVTFQLASLFQTYGKQNLLKMQKILVSLTIHAAPQVHTLCLHLLQQLSSGAPPGASAGVFSFFKTKLLLQVGLVLLPVFTFNQRVFYVVQFIFCS